MINIKDVKKIIRNKKQLMPVLALLALVLVIPLLLSLVKQRQEIRKRAGGGPVAVSLSPTNISKSPLDTFDVNVVLISSQTKITGGAQFELTFDGSMFTVNSATCDSGFPFAVGANGASGNIITIACSVNPGTAGITLQPGVAQNVSKFNVTVKNPVASGQSIISFTSALVGDPAGNDLTGTIASGVYNIIGNAIPTSPPTSTPTLVQVTNTPTPRPTTTPTPRPTTTPTPRPTTTPTLGPTPPLNTYPVEDTFIDQYNPTRNNDPIEFSNYGFKIIKYNTSTPLRSLIKFDLRSLPATAGISSAKLRLYVSGWAGKSGVVYVYQLKQPWVETEATWNKASASTAWQIPGADGGNDRILTPVTSFTISRLGLIDVDITSVVRSWQSSPQSNQGLMLIVSTANTSFNFSSSEAATNKPSLIIQ